MSRDKLKRVRIQGFRSIDDLTINVEGLQVLIGENGSGKSTILEAFEILSKTPTQPRFTFDIASRHGSIRELKRLGAPTLCLSAVIELSSAVGAPLEAEYSIALAPSGNGNIGAIVQESLNIEGVPLIERTAERVDLLRTDGDAVARRPGEPTTKRVTVSPEMTALSAIWGLDGPEDVARVRKVLEHIRVHLPFESRPRWSQQSDREQPGLRAMSQLAPAERLERGGLNLPSVFQRIMAKPELRAAALSDIRAGLGTDITNVSVPIKQVGGFGELTISISGVGDIPASQLSDGQLSFLALVALAHVDEADSVLLFDEPELHLNPSLMVRATWLFERIAERHPVILATHSDAVLDALTNESESVRIVELDAGRRTQLRKLDPERLKKWSEQYSTVSALRREGLLPDVTEAMP